MNVVLYIFFKKASDSKFISPEVSRKKNINEVHIACYLSGTILASFLGSNATFQFANLQQ